MSSSFFSAFSKRHQDAVRAKRIKPSIPIRLRRRLWLILREYNPSYYYQPDPNDNWNESTTTLDQLPNQLLKLYGAQKLEAFVGDQRREVDLEGFVMGAYPAQVFDVVELFWQDKPAQTSRFQSEVNQAFQEEKCPWLLSDGYFFQLDSQFLEIQVLQRAHELMAAAKFAGALDEFIEARNDLASGDHKGATHSAGKAFESVLKAMQNRQDGNAKALIEALKGTKFYAAFPEQLLAGFGENVLMGLPFIRNRIGAHGQGSDIVQVPRSLAELAVNLAGTFIVFVVKRHLELNPLQEEPSGTAAPDSLSDEIPF